MLLKYYNSAHVKINEKLQIEATRNGDYDVRVLGELALHINNEECNKIRVLCNIDCEDKNFKFQVCFRDKSFINEVRNL